MNTRFLRNLAVVGVGLAACTISASALTIDVDGANFNTAWPLAAIGSNPAGANRWETDLGGAGNYDASDIAARTGYGGTLTEYYKKNNGGSEEKSLTGSYDTTFANDLEDFLIEYKGGAFVSGSPIFLYVKDGNNSPIHYIFDITGWNGQDSIEGFNFWAADANGGTANGGISHVSIFGTATDTTTTVPDAGSMLVLLGVALGGLGLVRRGSR